jgi:hypothetical protein
MIRRRFDGWRYSLALVASDDLREGDLDQRDHHAKSEGA